MQLVQEADPEQNENLKKSRWILKFNNFMKHRLVLAMSSSYWGVQPSPFCYWRRNNKTVEVFDEENSTGSPVKLMLFLHYLKCRKQCSSGQSCPQDCKSCPLKCNGYRSTDTEDLTNFVSLRKLIFTPLNLLYRAVALCLLRVCSNIFLTLISISWERWSNSHDVHTRTYSQILLASLQCHASKWISWCLSVITSLQL